MISLADKSLANSLRASLVESRERMVTQIERIDSAVKALDGLLSEQLALPGASSPARPANAVDEPERTLVLGQETGGDETGDELDELPPDGAEPLDEFMETFRSLPQATRRRGDSKAFDEAVMRQLVLKGGVAMFRELVERTPRKYADRELGSHESDVRNSLQRMKEQGLVGRTGQAWSVRR